MSKQLRILGVVAVLTTLLASSSVVAGRHETRTDQCTAGDGTADEIARSLGIQNDMILTDRELQGTIGDPDDRTDNQETILACLKDLTNSKGATNIPFRASD